MVVPAIGTGNGPLDKAQFYHIFFDAFSSALSSDKIANSLPDEIDLAIWPRDTRGSFARSIDGIRDGAESVANKWQNAAHLPHSDAWVRIAGVCGGLVALTIAMMCSEIVARNYPAIFKTDRVELLRLFSIMAMSYGLADGAGRIIPSLGWEDPIIQLTLGFIIVPLTAPLMRALQQAQNEMNGSKMPEVLAQAGTGVDRREAQPPSGDT